MLNLCIMCVLCHRYIQYIYVRMYVGVGKLGLDWLTHRFGLQTFTFLILASASERSNIHGDQATNLKGCTFDKPLIAIGNSSKQETWRTRWRFDFYRSVLKCSYKILKFRRSQFFFFNRFNEHTYVSCKVDRENVWFTLKETGNWCWFVLCKKWNETAL